MAGTTFMDIICNHAMIEIDDVRLQNELSINPSRFFRKMSFYLINAIPRFSRPPEVRKILNPYINATYDDFDYIIPGNYDGGEITIETGIAEYEMASAVIISEDGYGEYQYIPIQITYDSETGNVVIAENQVQAGSRIAIDFYTDGYFRYSLSEEIKRILGLLVQIVWENRFINDFLLQQPKIKDKSFDIGNESNHMRASSERYRMLNEQVNQEMRQLENNCAYYKTVLFDTTANTVFSTEDNTDNP